MVPIAPKSLYHATRRWGNPTWAVKVTLESLRAHHALHPAPPPVAGDHACAPHVPARPLTAAGWPPAARARRPASRESNESARSGQSRCLRRATAPSAGRVGCPLGGGRMMSGVFEILVEECRGGAPNRYAAYRVEIFGSVAEISHGTCRMPAGPRMHSRES